MSPKRTKKLDTTVLVALIGVTGTVIAALISSPILGKLFDSGTPASTATASAADNGLVFVNDFENGQTSGFAFSTDQWQVIRADGNQVLELSGLSNNSTTAEFGPNDFSNGEILFRLNFKNSGGFVVNFRSSVGVQTYTLYFAPASNEISLGYASAEHNWDLEPFDGSSVRPFQFAEDIWYSVKLQASGDQFAVWVDGNKILTSNDPRLQQGTMELEVETDGTVWLDQVEVWEYPH